jgi:hypothetical protein
MEELRAKIKRDIESMFTSLDLLDDQMRNYSLNPKEHPRPDYERYNNLVLNYERLHRDGWNRDLRFRYGRLLEKRVIYEDTWQRWFEDRGLQYWKAGKEL